MNRFNYVRLSESILTAKTESDLNRVIPKSINLNAESIDSANCVKIYRYIFLSKKIRDFFPSMSEQNKKLIICLIDCFYTNSTLNVILLKHFNKTRKNKI